MSGILWPGEDRAGSTCSEASLVAAMVRVEAAWLAALVAAGIVPTEATDDLSGLLDDSDLPGLAGETEAGGNIVIPLLNLLRRRLCERTPAAATWVHRGLTSQDVLDTAFVLCLREANAALQSDFDTQIAALVGLSDTHRTSVMAGRTLTQHAVPIPFGLKAAQWLSGVLDARSAVSLADAGLAAQLGGAAGSLAAPVELARLSGAKDHVQTALVVVDDATSRLGLPAATPWQTNRSRITRCGDAFVTATDAWGHVANDVLLLARPEISELAEPVVEGRGGSSTMPQKTNPVLSVLIRRAALTGPQLSAQLHLASATAIDERPDGAWHLEWETLATLARRTVVAASHTTELLQGLHVDTGRMAAIVKSSASGLLAEQRNVANLFDSDAETGFDPGNYLGASDHIIDATIERARKESK